MAGGELADLLPRRLQGPASMADDRAKVEACLDVILRKKEAETLTLRQIRAMVEAETEVKASCGGMKTHIASYVDDWLKRKNAEGRGVEGEAEVEGEEDEEKEAIVESGTKEEEKRGRGKEKRKSASELKDGDDEDLICELSDKRKVVLSSFRGKMLISIREYYQKNGEMLPTSKGISLTVEQWKALREGMPAVQEAINRFQ